MNTKRLSYLCNRSLEYIISLTLDIDIDYQKVKPGVNIDYQSIGGGGVKQFTAKTVDFGASDASLSLGFYYLLLIGILPTLNFPLRD
jgi:hypothetical protein